LACVWSSEVCSSVLVFFFFFLQKQAMFNTEEAKPSVVRLAKPPKHQTYARTKTRAITHRARKKRTTPTNQRKGMQLNIMEKKRINKKRLRKERKTNVWHVILHLVLLPFPCSFLSLVCCLLFLQFCDLCFQFRNLLVCSFQFSFQLRCGLLWLQCCGWCRCSSTRYGFVISWFHGYFLGCFVDTT